MKIILVTGGAGFIGSHFINYMLKKYNEILIVNFDKLTYSANLDYIIDSSKHIFIKGDICNSKDLEDLFSNYKFDMVVNFAAETHVDSSIVNPYIFTQVNILGFQKLLYKAKEQNVQRFIQISTDEVYGPSLNKSIFTEDSSLKPDNPYSASKAGAEMIIQSVKNTFDYHAIVIRSSNNYGIYQYPEKFIPISIKRLIGGEKIKIYGNGLQKRDWIDVKDNVRLIGEIAYKGNLGEIYNVCTGREITNIDIAKIIIESVNRNLSTLFSFEKDVIFIEDRKGHDFKYTMSNDKINMMFNQCKFKKIEEEIDYIVKYYLRQFGVI